MAATVSARTQHSTQGVVLMTLAMLSIPMVDGLAKYLSADYSPLFLGWARYAVASVVVLPVAGAVHGARIFPSERPRSHVLRTVFLVGAMTLYFMAIARAPLATAASAFFVGPIIAVALSVLWLGERMTPRRGFALALGAVGSTVILRPGGSADPGVLLALASGVLFALYLVTTRQASQVSDPIRTLSFQCLFGTLLLTPQAIATWRTPSLDDWVFLLPLGALSAVSHLMSIAAFRRAEAATLSPLVYLELVGASLIGYVVFAEVPNTATVAGASLIVLGGLVLLERGRGAPQSKPDATGRRSRSQMRRA